MKLIRIPYHPQETKYTCASACMRMIFEFFGIKKPEKYFTKKLKTNKISGVRVESLINFVEKQKLCYVVFRNASIKDLEKRFNRDYLIIVGYRHPGKEGHYAVIVGIDEKNIYLRDPNPYTPEVLSYSKKYFRSLWNRGLKYDNDKKWFIGIKKK